MSEERYEIIKLLGKGRTGGVYEAEDTRLGRKVAMRRFFSQTELTDVSEYEEDFLNISQSLSALQHPNLLRVFDAGMDEDGAFIISQMMKGDSLHNRLKEGPLSSWDVWDLGHQMLDALSTAHGAGFVHGAITPGSILMSPRARGGFLYVILDMGLCRLAPLIQGKDSILSMMADPAILAPELFDGSEATEKADLYMLGNILYMCLAGGHPFAGKSLEECSKLHRAGLPLLQDFAPEAPDDFVAWIAELCEINAHDRPHSVVTALKTMPKVEKPVRGNATGIHIDPTTATAPVAIATPSTLGSTVVGSQNPPVSHPASATAGASNLGQGSASAQPSHTIPPQKKSNKGLFITLGAIAALVIVLVIGMTGSGGKTGEEIAAENEKQKKGGHRANSKENVSSKTTSKRPRRKQPAVSKSYPKEEVISFEVREGSPLDNSWKAIAKKKQRLTMNGWMIEDAKGLNPSIAKRITGTDIEDMFKRGWSMKYVVYIDKGSHVVGMKIAAEDNLFWMKTNKSLSFYFRITKDGDDVILTHKATGIEAKLVKGAGKFLMFEMRAKPGDRSGKFSLYINDQHLKQFEGTFDQDDKLIPFYSNTIFSASGNTDANDGVWVISDFTLHTGWEE